MELEELQDQLSEVLLQLKLDQLQEVCWQAKISTEKETRKHTLIRAINDAADTAIDTEDEEVAHAYLDRLVKHAKEVKERDSQTKDSDSVSQDAAALANLKEQYAALQLSFQTANKKLEEEMSKLTNKIQKEAELLEVISQLKVEIAEIKGAIQNSHRPARPRPTSGHLSKGCRMQRRPSDRSEQIGMLASTVATCQPTPGQQSELQPHTHKILTDSIKHLETKVALNGQDQTPETVTVSLLSPKRRAQLLNLIGRKHIISCLLDGRETKALWDTGSQVCLINEKWRQQNLPHTSVRSLSEIIGSGALDGRAVNQTLIPFSGWVEVKFALPTAKPVPFDLLVPVLVSSEYGVAEEPIIGFNVIEHLLEKGIEPPRVATEVISAAFSIDCKKAEVFLKVMKSGDDGADEGAVKTGRKLISIPAGKTKTVKCRVRAGPLSTHQDALFEPDPSSQLLEGLEAQEGVIKLQQAVQLEEGEPWLCPLTISTAIMESQNEAWMSVVEIPKADLRQAQQEDPVIGQSPQTEQEDSSEDDDDWRGITGLSADYQEQSVEHQCEMEHLADPVNTATDYQNELYEDMEIQEEKCSEDASLNQPEIENSDQNQDQEDALQSPAEERR
ncbi:hypothetical protein DNTS_017659 [Danionella cerebrum]|uniref:Uncharacterized protein n=1 Tax=Danionella cerebrum TaxID=2873325 RepID=A0A553MXF6_9TELE|nr:hypothetical protein DNTS_017659 [Danionella translucida]